MRLESFHKVPAGAIETLFDGQKQAIFKRADLGKYLGIENIKYNYTFFIKLHLFQIRSGWGRSDSPPWKSEKCHNVFINLDGSTEMAVRSKKPKAVGLVKWIVKEGVERIQEEHQLAVIDHDS